MRSEGQKPGNNPMGRIPQWGLPLWYVIITIILIWIWQSTLTQLTVKTIPYSEFKDRLTRREVTECKVGATEIVGSIKTKSDLPALTNATPSLPPEFVFRTIRVEDPKLVEQLEQANVKFLGDRPNALTQFIMA